MAGRMLCIALLLFPITGCVGPTRPDEPATEELPILAELSGRFGGPPQSVRIVARDEPTLILLRLPKLEVNFHKQMVLFASLGRISNEQTDIRITRVWREGSLIRADVRILRPQALPRQRHPSTPWHAVVVPKSDLNVDGFSPDVP
jgi:hypothetical protein